MNRGAVVRAVLGVVIVIVALGAPVAWWVNRTEVSCGVVIGIEQTSITDVTGFKLRSTDGVTTSFVVVPARLAPDSFVPGHLREHRALATPVCVTTHPIDTARVVLDLRDAPVP